MRNREHETAEETNSPSAAIAGVVWLVSSLLILFARCNSDPEITRGRVIEKRHEPERTWTQMMLVRVGKTTTTVPLVHTDDEDWILVVRGWDQNGDETTEEVYVEPRTYKRVRVGDEFEYDPSEATLEDPVQKREK